MTRLRLGLAILGFVLAALSVVRNDSQLGWVAIAVLLASAIIRVIQRKRDKPTFPDDPGV